MSPKSLHDQTFEAFVPTGAPDALRARFEPGSSAGDPMKHTPLVLIVDDERDNREAYAEYLQFRGFRTRQAATGAGALREARRSKPDVVVLDMRLPDLPGMEVSRRLRSGGFACSIIALSACVFQADVDAALESGCDAFLAKPCLPDALVEEIRRLLGGRQALATAPLITHHRASND
jgi:DNA-binding response OmpR family regulator